jgi:hypothetical protein
MLEGCQKTLTCGLVTRRGNTGQVIRVICVLLQQRLESRVRGTNDALTCPPKFFLVRGRRCKDRCREGTGILGAAVKIRGRARPKGALEAVGESVGRGYNKRKAIAIFGS